MSHRVKYFVAADTGFIFCTDHFWLSLPHIYDRFTDASSAVLWWSNEQVNKAFFLWSQRERDFPRSQIAKEHE